MDFYRGIMMWTFHVSFVFVLRPVLLFSFVKTFVLFPSICVCFNYNKTMIFARSSGKKSSKKGGKRDKEGTQSLKDEKLHSKRDDDEVKKGIDDVGDIFDEIYKDSTGSLPAVLVTKKREINDENVLLQEGLTSEKGPNTATNTEKTHPYRGTCTI